jgi:DNA-binding MarR family transcriptional regulator
VTAEDEIKAETDPHADLWLTPAQLDSWMSVVRLMTRLPRAIDADLQRAAGLSMIEYMTMAILSKSPDRTMRMSELAEETSASLSRLSHLVKRLETRGWVLREADPADGRFTNAILTTDGMHKLESAAPAHLASVRRLVIDNLTPEQLRRLGRDADRVVGRIDSPAR